jgi:hypothetical protein
VREAVAEARRQIAESIAEARQEAEQAARDAAEARRDAEKALEDLMHAQEHPEPKVRITRVGIGDFLLQLSWLWVLASAVIKYTYKGRMQAEVKAAQATETAEAESLKRQVVEARMAAMQAQVEPHFLFNTLASIDHLIETDPARASQMQKNLIALLRASMPTMREASGGSANGLRDLGRELPVIRPYLEILKVRMEERLTTEIDVPDGLLSAEFPPMMVQTLVENAIKHGLEPKAEGGNLRVAAEIVHGKLQVTVADTGLGFGKAATAGTGVGLANIRERLQLLYGTRATLTVAENQPTARARAGRRRTADARAAARPADRGLARTADRGRGPKRAGGGAAGGRAPARHRLPGHPHAGPDRRRRGAPDRPDAAAAERAAASWPTTSLPEIVFITAYDQYAVEAFEQGVATTCSSRPSASACRLTVDRIRRRLEAPPRRRRRRPGAAPLQQLLHQLAARLNPGRRRST